MKMYRGTDAIKCLSNIKISTADTVSASEDTIKPATIKPAKGKSIENIHEIEGETTGPDANIDQVFQIDEEAAKTASNMETSRITSDDLSKMMEQRRKFSGTTNQIES